MTNIKGGIREDVYLFASYSFRRQIEETLWQELQRARHAVLEKEAGVGILFATDRGPYRLHTLYDEIGGHPRRVTNKNFL
jgi:hypothetical protein